MLRTGSVRKSLAPWAGPTAEHGVATSPAPAAVHGRRQGELQALLLELVPQLQVGSDAAHVPLLVGQHERDADAVAPRPGGTANPVDVRLLVLRRVEVYDVRDAVQVEAPGRDVGGDECLHPPGIEGGECPLTLGLA